MSMLSELKKRAGPRVRIRTASSPRSRSGGVAVSLVLSRKYGPDDIFEVARPLVHAGVSVREAKRTIEELMARDIATVEVPFMTDYDALLKTMARQGVAVRRLERRAVDVKALRARLGLSQEAFARRYGLDVATVRNWEQGRTRPDGPASILLQVIDRDPDAVLDLLVS